MIYTRPVLRPVGVATNRDFLTPHRTAAFGITIGDLADRERGDGREATRLPRGRIFAELGGPNIWLDTISTNPGAIRAYIRAGFREIGRIREARRIGGIVADVMLVECLAPGFRVAFGTDEPSGVRGAGSLNYCGIRVFRLSIGSGKVPSPAAAGEGVGGAGRPCQSTTI